QDKNDLQHLHQLYQHIILPLTPTHPYLSTFLKQNINKQIIIQQHLNHIKHTTQHLHTQIQFTSITFLTKLHNHIQTHNLHTNKTFPHIKTAITLLHTQIKQNHHFLTKQFQTNNQPINHDLHN
ncbi:hypothetical protein, partial [Priestia megaterium]|uniref:hypothetical protein n=1 Tax=Priestia megaterium TaxID=1404 RepID=UPI001C99E034